MEQYVYWGTFPTEDNTDSFPEASQDSKCIYFIQHL